MLSLLFALALGASPAAEAPAPPPAEPLPPRVSIITNPDWLTKPGPDDLWLLYPASAALAEIGGKVVIECRVDAQGYLRNCRVVSEDPAGWGFGEAALKASKIFHMKPATVDGQPVDGALIRVPLSFHLGEEADPADFAAKDAGLCYGVLSVYAIKSPSERWAAAGAAEFSGKVGLAMSRDGKSTPLDVEKRLAAERDSAARMTPAAQAERRQICKEKLQLDMLNW